jgi:hypothetical protein
MQKETSQDSYYKKHTKSNVAFERTFGIIVLAANGTKAIVIWFKTIRFQGSHNLTFVVIK